MRKKNKDVLIKFDYLDVNTMENSSINVYSGHRNLLLYGLQFSNEDLSYNLNLEKITSCILKKK